MFQKEVQSTLSALQSSPSVSSEDINVLEQLLNRGENYAVDLPQLEELKQVSSLHNSNLDMIVIKKIYQIFESFYQTTYLGTCMTCK